MFQKMTKSLSKIIFGNIPKIFGNVPKIFGNDPKIFGNDPKIFGNVPKIFGNVPKIFGNVQGSLISKPRNYIISTFSPASAGHGTFLKFAKYDQKWQKLDKKCFFLQFFANWTRKTPKVTPCICPVGTVV